MVKYYFRRRARYTDELYSVIYLHKNRLQSYGLACDYLTGQLARCYSATPVPYDLSCDLRVNRVNDLCKEDKWEI